MALKECPNCGVEMNKDETICPICRYEFPQRRSNVLRIAVIFLGLVIVLELLLNFRN